ncbi:putative transposase domain protein [Microcystis aeruginosa FACHB-905 = DIANCHI905]|nr:putative transposase domain protein [Microcystis aeruginosa FACHB-905 = DIANCHI905]
MCQRLVWLNCLLSPTQEALPTDGLGFTSICLTRTQVKIAQQIRE